MKNLKGILPIFVVILVLSLVAGTLPLYAETAEEIRQRTIKQRYNRYTELFTKDGQDLEEIRLRLAALKEAQGSETTGEVQVTKTTLPTDTRIISSPDEVTVDGVKPPFYSGTTRPESAKSGDNYCGQYALSTIFPKLGLDGDFDRIFKDMNPASIYSAPTQMQKYVRARGGKARGVHDTTNEQLKEQLDQGNPAAILVRSGSTFRSLHWIAVTGYREVNGKTEWKVSDTVWGTGSKNGYVWMSDDKLQERWNSYFDDGGVFDKNLAYSREAIFFDKNPSFFSGFSTAWEDSLLGASTDLVTGWKNRDWRKLSAGVIEAGAGLFALPAIVKGRLLKAGGSWLDDWGRKTRKKGGVLRNIAGGGAQLIGKTAKFAGSIFDGIGKGISMIGNKIGGLFN